MIVQKVTVTQPVRVTAAPLTREAFGSFGFVLTNPAPATLPAPDLDVSGLPCGAAVANQGTAIQYRELGKAADLYVTAPSRAPATPRATMFVCRGRLGESPSSASLPSGVTTEIEIGVLERHPFTTQTFVPLSGADGRPAQYLVVVAPSFAPSAADEGLPVPERDEDDGLPGRGLPDVSRLRAFVATGGQAVTYAPGTWHAPMVALVKPNAAVDFAVFQAANGVPVEDCQEVTLEPAAGRSENRVFVRVPVEEEEGPRLWKL